MYRKSVETTDSHTIDTDAMSQSEPGALQHGDTITAHDTANGDFRSESIAALRAKAQEYKAKLADVNIEGSDVDMADYDSESGESCISNEDGKTQSVTAGPLELTGTLNSSQEQASDGVVLDLGIHKGGGTKQDPDQINKNVKNRLSLNSSHLPRKMIQRSNNKTVSDDTKNTPVASPDCKTTFKHTSDNAERYNKDFENAMTVDPRNVSNNQIPFLKSAEGDRTTFPAPMVGFPDALAKSNRHAALLRGMIPPVMNLNYFHNHYGISHAHSVMTSHMTSSTKSVPATLGFGSSWTHQFPHLLPAMPPTMAPDPLKSQQLLEAYNIGKMPFLGHAYPQGQHQSMRVSTGREAELPA